jgi:hypothetical protein
MHTLEEQLKQQEEANKVASAHALSVHFQALQDTLEQLKRKRKDLGDASSELSRLKIERDALQNEVAMAKKQANEVKRVCGSFAAR